MTKDKKLDYMFQNRIEAPSTIRTMGNDLPKFSWGSFWIGFCISSLVWAMLNYFINYYNGIN